MNTPARRDGTPERSKGYEPRGSQPTRGRADRSARSGDSYGSRGASAPRSGARGDAQSWGGGSGRGDSRGGSRGGAGSYDNSRGNSRGAGSSYEGSRGGSGSYGGSRGGSDSYGSRGGSDSRGGARGGSGYGESRSFGGNSGRGGYEGSRGGGNSGNSGRGGYEGSRGGNASRAGGYEGARGGNSSRGGGYEGSRDGNASRGGGYDGSRGGSSARGGSYEGARGNSRGAAPSARTNSSAPRGGDARGTQGRSGFGRPSAPSAQPAAKKVHRPSPDVSVLLSNAKPARHQHVDQPEAGGPKKLPWGEGERLQKVLAKAGVASRRAAEEMIDAGRIEVDGKIVREQGLRIDPQNAVVRVDGVRVVVRAEQVYLALNKPKGWQSTMSDEMGRPCVGDIVAERVAAGQRLFHVGRLDADTEGLLLLTNDGDLAHRLMHPSFEVSKTYLATVNGEVKERQVAKLLREGVELEDGPAKVDRFVVLEVGQGRSLVKVVLHEGRKHIVRRLLAAVDHPVIALVRTHIGPVALGDQRPGALRVLGRDEIGKLYEAVSL